MADSGFYPLANSRHVVSPSERRCSESSQKMKGRERWSGEVNDGNSAPHHADELPDYVIGTELI
jgi:hypothetical protein